MQTAQKIEIVFEDNDFLAVNKVAGLPSHKTHDPERAHLQGLVEQQVGRELVLFHRLDLDTTGVVLFGKNPSLNRAMTEAFRDRLIKKTYWAVVEGNWPATWHEVKTYIKKGGGGRWTNVPRGRGGDFAHTLFKRIKGNGHKTWIQASPQTGRTHQIRLHCLERGHSILGDKLYTPLADSKFPMALHAAELEFKHPLSEKNILIKAAPPRYWKTHWLKGL